jgi:carboxypeptidase Taq
MSKNTLSHTNGIDKNSQDTSAYNDLKFYFSYLNTLFTIRRMLVVDMATTMPPKGINNRMNDISSITKRIYSETTSDSIAKLLEEAKNKAHVNSGSWTSWDQANLEEMDRIFKSFKSLPTALYISLVRIQNSGHQHHRKAIAEKQSWKDVQPHIEQIVTVYRQAAKLKQDVFQTKTPYDALLQTYAHGLSEESIEAIYDRAIPQLKDLTRRKLKHQGLDTTNSLSNQTYTQHDLLQFNQGVLNSLGFDFSRGTLSTTNVSPMAAGSRDDARVIIRCKDDSNFMTSLEDTLYQGAHGLYLQSLPEEWHNQPVGQAQSATIKTAVSLLYKIILGRRKEFFEFLGPIAQNTLKGFDNKTYDPEAYYKMKHTIRVTSTRNDADAMSKILHDVIRYRIEKELINGEIEVMLSVGLV